MYAYIITIHRSPSPSLEAGGGDQAGMEWTKDFHRGPRNG